MSTPLKTTADRCLPHGAAEEAGCDRSSGIPLIAPNSSQADEVRSPDGMPDDPSAVGWKAQWPTLRSWPIDKLDLRLPRVTSLLSRVADFIKQSRGTEDSTRRLGSRYYEFVTDLRPMGIDARLQLGLKQPGEHAGEGKLELIDTGTKTLSEITAEILEIIDISPVDLEIMRIYLCADMHQIPVEWFLNRARVKFKRIAREISQLKAERIGKVGIQTLTAGQRPNLIRFYDKVAEYKEQLRKLQRKMPQTMRSEVTLQTVFGVAENAIITRIERQYGGGCVPVIAGGENEPAIKIEVFGQLVQLPEANPFANIEISHGKFAHTPTLGECDLNTFAVGKLLREWRDEMGPQQFHRFLNAKSSGNAARYEKRYAAFLDPGDELITGQTIYETYRESVKRQLAA